MVSVCIITKNEEENIGRCLASITKLGYEIVVVDTGSTDKTKEIVAKYTDSIYDFEWCDDFAAARNYAISKAKNDFIFMIDSDEYLISFNKKKIERHFKKHFTDIGQISIVNEQYDSDGNKSYSTTYMERFFFRKLYEYRGAIHEQIEGKRREKKGEDIVKVQIKVGHTGYALQGDEKKKKVERNLSLLFKEYEKDKSNPYIVYQIGKTYYYINDFVNAEKYLDIVLHMDVDPYLDYVIDMIVLYGYALINLGKQKEALMLENVYNTFSGTCEFVFMMGLIYMKNNKIDDAIREFNKALEFEECNVKGANGKDACYNLALLYEMKGDFLKAAEYYKKSAQLSL